MILVISNVGFQGGTLVLIASVPSLCLGSDVPGHCSDIIALNSLDKLVSLVAIVYCINM